LRGGGAWVNCRPGIIISKDLFYCNPWAKGLFGHSGAFFGAFGACQDKVKMLPFAFGGEPLYQGQTKVQKQTFLTRIDHSASISTAIFGSH
jgi:hypothetical protein